MDATISKCEHCDFETDSVAELHAHTVDASVSETRWSCPGSGCKQVFCTFEALNGEGAHFDHCPRFEEWRRKRKYGRNMTGRLRGASALRDGKPKSPISKVKAAFLAKYKVGTKKATDKDRNRRRKVDVLNEDEDDYSETKPRTSRRQKTPSSKQRKVAISAIPESDPEAAVEDDDDYSETKARTSRRQKAPSLKRRKVVVNAIPESDTEEAVEDLFGVGQLDDEAGTLKAFGCSACSAQFSTLAEAKAHAKASNTTMQHWECLGCDETFCDRDLLIWHFDDCFQFKEWLIRSDTAWHFRRDDGFIGNAGKPRERLANPKAKAISVELSAPSLSTTESQPDIPSAVWDGYAWRTKGDMDGSPHLRRRGGFMYYPGTNIPIPGTNIPFDPEPEQLFKTKQAPHDLPNRMMKANANGRATVVPGEGTRSQLPLPKFTRVAAHTKSMPPPFDSPHQMMRTDSNSPFAVVPGEGPRKPVQDPKRTQLDDVFSTLASSHQMPAPFNSPYRNMKTDANRQFTFYPGEGPRMPTQDPRRTQPNDIVSTPAAFQPMPAPFKLYTGERPRMPTHDPKRTQLGVGTPTIGRMPSLNSQRTDPEDDTPAFQPMPAPFHPPYHIMADAKGRSTAVPSEDAVSSPTLFKPRK